MKVKQNHILFLIHLHNIDQFQRNGSQIVLNDPYKVNLYNSILLPFNLIKLKYQFQILDWIQISLLPYTKPATFHSNISY